MPKTSCKFVLSFLMLLSVHMSCLQYCFRGRIAPLRRAFIAGMADKGFTDMSVDDLKKFIRSRGGKPKQMRKEELLFECERLGANSGVESENSTRTMYAANDTRYAQKRGNSEPKEWVDDKINLSQLKQQYIKQGDPTLFQTPISNSINVNQPSQSVSTPRLRSLRPIPIEQQQILDKKESSDIRGMLSINSNFPTGDNRDSRIISDGTCDMDLTFLGTASCVPSSTRGVSCVALRYDTYVWLFDCGESSQIQLQKSKLRPSKIKKIFISHAHGDHCFGLPGVLCMMGQAQSEEASEAGEPVDIYGPEGIRDLVRAVVQLTYSRAVVPHRIHELKEVPYLHGKCVRRPPPRAAITTSANAMYGEVPGGMDLYPDEKGCYRVCENEDITVSAAPMQHSIPCVGYVVLEKTRQGRLRIELIQDIVAKNFDKLKSEFGMRDPRKVFTILKDLKPGQMFTMPDGTELRAEDVMDPQRDGRKVVVMGDTCSGDFIAENAMDADVLIHEATNAYLHWASTKYSSYEQVEREAFLHGHSTPQMAARFSKRVRAKQLILTHFSARYGGDSAESNMRTMWTIEDMARRQADLWGKNDVLAAWDHMQIPVHSKGPRRQLTAEQMARRAETIISDDTSTQSIDADMADTHHRRE